MNAIHTITLPRHLSTQDVNRIRIHRSADAWLCEEYTTSWAHSWTTRHPRCKTAGEAVDTVRAIVARRKIRVGRDAVAKQWDALCESQSAIARTARTPDALLRDSAARSELYRVIAAGKRYSAELDWYAVRSVIAAAREILVARNTRRDARTQWLHATSPAGGRIAAQCTPSAVAKRLTGGQHKRNWIKRQLQRPEVLERMSASQIVTAARKCTLGKRQRADLVRTLQAKPRSDASLRYIVETIGEIGDQAERDMAELAEHEELSGKKGRNHWYEKSVIDRIQLNGDCNAALVTIADIKSWGAYGYGGSEGYGKQSGCSYRVYLIVRDASRGSAHILRVPPKYGNPNTQFYGKFTSQAERIEAAREWTFAGHSLAGAIEA